MSPRSFLPVAFLLLVSLAASAQNYTHIYHLDNNYNSVEASKATITGKGYYEAGLFKLDCFSNKTNLLLMSAHFKDSSLASLEGLFQTYDVLVRLTTEGNFVNNEKEGTWQGWNERGEKTDSSIFGKGVRVRHATFSYHKNRMLSSFEWVDSLNNTLYKKYLSDSGTFISEANFAGQSGIVNYMENGLVKTDSVFTREETEAVFSADKYAWPRFLERSLANFNPMDRGAPAGKYQVVVRFIISEDGTISNITAETSYGYGMEDKVIMMLLKSPDWVPAKQYGRYVKAYRRQPVTFVVEIQ